MPFENQLKLHVAERHADGVTVHFPLAPEFLNSQGVLHGGITASIADEAAWQVTLKDGSDETLTLLPAPMIDGKPAVLKGLLGRVPTGYKLFPPSTIGEILFDAAEEAKPDK